jgi:hypothetical protein
MIEADILGLILRYLEVPEMRMDTTKKENLLWLQRNLPINNGATPEVERALTLIRHKLKTFL